MSVCKLLANRDVVIIYYIIEIPLDVVNTYQQENDQESVNLY